VSGVTSPTRSRTRQAILDAAIEMLGQNAGASLGEIAAAAQVGRTTLHRYFGERSDLIAAVSVEGNERLNRATALARLDEGTGAEAVLRLCREYFDLGGLLSLVFSEPSLIDENCWDPHNDVAFTRVIRRGHADGSIDAGLPADWLESLLWSQLYAAWSYVRDHPQASRHHVLDLLLRTLGNALTARA
jgi:TetR/AcrR family transcriptional regulator, repressor for lfrA